MRQARSEHRYRNFSFDCSSRAVTVVDLLGHAGLDHVRVYTQPTEDDKIKALNNLIVDE